MIKILQKLAVFRKKRQLFCQTNLNKSMHFLCGLAKLGNVKLIAKLILKNYVRKK
jgi:hypothetical protein